MRSMWTVATLKNSEGALKDALRHVRAQEFEPYSPMFREKRNSVGVRKISPLFPGYLFVLVKRNQDWRPLCYTRGISRMILTTSEAPARVLDEDIQRLKNSEDELGYIRIEENEPRSYVPEQIVLALKGMWVGKAGIYVGRGSSKNRAEVIFEMMGRAVKADVLLTELA